MMKLTYIGTEEKVFPTLGITLKPGDIFDAPDGFSHPDFKAGSAAKPTPTTTNPSAASDTKAGE
jgi:hypothetical protein